MGSAGRANPSEGSTRIAVPCSLSSPVKPVQAVLPLLWAGEAPGALCWDPALQGTRATLTGSPARIPADRPCPRCCPAPLFLQMQWDNVAEPGEVLGTCKSRKNLQIQEKPANLGKSLELASIQSRAWNSDGQSCAEAEQSSRAHLHFVIPWGFSWLKWECLEGSQCPQPGAGERGAP